MQTLLCNWTRCECLLFAYWLVSDYPTRLSEDEIVFVAWDKMLIALIIICGVIKRWYDDSDVLKMVKAIAIVHLW